MPQIRRIHYARSAFSVGRAMPVRFACGLREGAATNILDDVSCHHCKKVMQIERPTPQEMVRVEKIMDSGPDKDCGFWTQVYKVQTEDGTTHHVTRTGSPGMPILMRCDRCATYKTDAECIRRVQLAQPVESGRAA